MPDPTSEQVADADGFEIVIWCDDDCPEDCMADHQGEQ